MSALINLHEHSNRLKNQSDDEIESRAEKDLQSIISDRKCEDVVTEIGRDPQDLFRFAYELRKQDYDDQYTWTLMNGQVEPSLLISIFLANKWNPRIERMDVDRNIEFRIFNNHKGDVMTTNTTSNKVSSPLFVIKNSNASNQQIQDFYIKLTEQGCQIQSTNLDILTTEKNPNTGLTKLVWIPENQKPSNASWLLVPSETKGDRTFPYFHIQKVGE